MWNPVIGNPVTAINSIQTLRFPAQLCNIGILVISIQTLQRLRPIVEEWDNVFPDYLQFGGHLEKASLGTFRDKGVTVVG